MVESRELQKYQSCRTIYGGSICSTLSYHCITNITAVPAAFATIVKSAFTGSALAGGAMGTMIVAMQKGIARGIFSNESGLGSAPIAAAAAQNKRTGTSGTVSMTGTFIDTIVICTMTGLSIVITGSWMIPDWKVWQLQQMHSRKDFRSRDSLHLLH